MEANIETERQMIVRSPPPHPYLSVMPTYYSIIYSDYRDHGLDEQDLKWLFLKAKYIYRDFATLPQDQRLVSLVIFVG